MLKDAQLQCFEFIENDNMEGLMKYLGARFELMVNEILDTNGKTLLHESAFQDNFKIMQALILYAKAQKLSKEQIQAWINQKDDGDGFTALHFASFKGNVDLCEILVDNGADLNVRNNFGINVIHVAAQGDMPISIFYFKLKGLDLRSRDNRGSTPLHWAAYSRSEVCLVYLLSWIDFLDD